LRDRRSPVPFFQGGPERSLERAEPLFIWPPLVEAFTVDRAADLLGTDGSHRPLIEWKLRQASSNSGRDNEQVPDFAFNVVDHPFVDHPVDLAGLNSSISRRSRT
jgi:hypothetical protein